MKFVIDEQSRVHYNRALTNPDMATNQLLGWLAVHEKSSIEKVSKGLTLTLTLQRYWYLPRPISQQT
jgi:hypothetical protein